MEICWHAVAPREIRELHLKILLGDILAPLCHDLHRLLLRCHGAMGDVRSFLDQNLGWSCGIFAVLIDLDTLLRQQKVPFEFALADRPPALARLHVAVLAKVVPFENCLIPAE